MAELPGWDRTRLAAASPSDVEAARMLVYARARAPEITRDHAGRIAELERTDWPAKRREAKEHELRRRAIEELRGAERAQAMLREVLELDVEDEEEVER